MTNKKLVLITQDKKLGKAILNFNKINSVKANNADCR